MKLDFKTKFCYGIGNLGYGTISQTVNNFIMFFGTSVLGISGTLVGIAVAISVFWDGISDPIIGYASDKHNNKVFGKRLGFMLIASFGMAFFNILLWTVPFESSDAVKFVWLLVCLLTLETFCTTFATPYVALGIDLAPDYHEQSRLQGYKTVFFILGMIMPSILMLLFMPSNSGEQAQFMQSGYVNIAYFTSILGLICGAICIIGTLKKVQKIYKFKKSKKTKTSTKSVFNSFFKIFHTFFLALKKKNFGSIIIGYSVALISTAFLCSVGLHLFTYAYHFTSSQIAILMAGLFVSAIISQPFWIHLSNRIDKKPALKVSLVVVLIGIGLTSLSFIFRLYIETHITFFVVLGCIFVCGFGTGALYSLPISMYADAITMDRLKTKQNTSGIYSGFMTLAYNIANSVALLIIGVLLDLIKFNAAEPVQAISVQNWLGGIVFIGCAVSIALALSIFSKYDLKRSDVLKSRLKHKEI
ncbi:MAG: MFS transporter [Clostridia bacterium]|jgi:Na+/melibiose symporter-like transporter|nr:MFS transporter [Clostridia bacterium]MDD4408480.1 MFS transporter [Clostridia bacterium]